MSSALKHMKLFFIVFGPGIDVLLLHLLMSLLSYFAMSSISLESSSSMVKLYPSRGSTVKNTRLRYD